MLHVDMLHWSEIALLTTLAVATVISGVRVFIGPTLADRVVSLDLLAIGGVSLMTASAVVFDQTAFLDVALLLALIAFISTAAFARYLERSSEDS
jgi:multicomponent Na+:H+ antiporter subunit F